MHHADPLGKNRPHIVRMMLESITGEFLAKAAFMHHDDKAHNASNYYNYMWPRVTAVNINLLLLILRFSSYESKGNSLKKNFILKSP